MDAGEAQQAEADGTEVAVECGVAEQCLHPTRKIDRREVAPDELETAVSRDTRVREGDRDITFTTPENVGSGL
jgi:hypothetical protein